MTSAQEMSALLADKARSTGSLADALAFVCAHLRHPDVAASAVDVFPHCATLAGQHGEALCRCRGMIQEIQSDVSLFCASRADFFGRRRRTQDVACETQRRGVTDAQAGHALPTDDEDDDELLDATVLYVVPVPGNAHFYSDQAPDHEWGGDGAGGTTDTNAAQVHYDDDDGHVQETQRGHKRPASSSGWDGPHFVPGVGCESTAYHRGAMDAYLNLPHPSLTRALQTACIVTVPLPRMQATQAGVALRINDVVDFYGYLQPDMDAEVTGSGPVGVEGVAAHARRARREAPASSNVQDTVDDNEEDSTGAEGGGVMAENELSGFGVWRAAGLSRRLVTHLVCLGYSPVRAAPVTLPGAVLCEDHFLQARRQAVAYLAQHVCHGDELAAEYLLLHLCARVTAHHAVTPVGDVPLLVYSPAMDSAAWSAALRAVAPVSELHLSGGLLRSAGTRVQPRHDVDHNVLRAGVLQVANGSHMTVDCASLTEGGEAHGSARPLPWADALFSAVHKQTLLLEYPYQTLELPVDVGFLALVRTPAEESGEKDGVTVPLAGVHPIFRFALQLRWRPVSAVEEGGGDAGGDRVSDAVRAYINTVRHLTPDLDAAPEAGESVTGACEGREKDEDALRHAMSEMLVRTAQELPGWHNGDALVHNNTFSVVTALVRVQAASRGRRRMTLDDLHYVMKLERQRMERNGRQTC